MSSDRGRGDNQRGRPRSDRSSGRPPAGRRPRREGPPPEGENFGKVAKGSVHGPEVDRDAVIGELDASVRHELSTLPGTLAEKVAGHLVMTGRLLDVDPELAFAHARTAHDLAPRIVAIREALAVAAYTAGDFRTALREGRTVRRMTGDESWLPMIADCERGLERPERALDLLGEVDIARLPESVRAECLIVMSGARRDLGQLEAALAVLDTSLLRSRVKSEWSARYRVAYADTLSALGRDDEASRWLTLAAASDPTGASGAAERLAEADGDAPPEFLEVLEVDPEQSSRD